jgi:hypothetical protein
MSDKPFTTGIIEYLLILCLSIKKPSIAVAHLLSSLLENLLYYTNYMHPKANLSSIATIIEVIDIQITTKD